MRNRYLKTLALLAAVAGLAMNEFRASAQETLLIGWTNLWAFNDTTTPTENLHGTGWELPAYNTNSAPGWKTGPALFGNDTAGLYDGPGRPFSGGIGGFLTPLNRGVAAAADRVTFYFRKSFNYSGPSGVILETKWVHDDGFIVYINGTEILRSKMQGAPTDPVTWATLGANHDSAAPGPLVVEGFEYSQDLPSTALVTGENVIAVELHQSSTTSSDVSFAMELKAVVPFAPAITNAAQPADRVVLQNRSATLAVFATGSRPLSYQWFFQPAGGGGFGPILDATNSTYTIVSMQPENAGDYYCTVSNPIGSIDSRSARVSFSTDSDAPFVARADQAGALDRVVVEYNEAVDPTTAEDEFNYEVYDSSNVALGVNLATLNPGGSSVTLSLAFPMAENELHTVSITTVADLTGVNVITTTNVPFRSWTTSPCGGVLFEVFDTTPNNSTAVANLLTHPNFPNNPRDVYRLASFDSNPAWGAVGQDDLLRQDYGGRIRGVFIPPVSGNWKFYMRGDDGAEVWFNPTGPGAGGRTRICFQGGFVDGAFAETPPGTRTSAPIPLTGGQAYYIEGLYQEDGGGDYMQVAAKLADDPTDPATLLPISGDRLGSPLAPPNVAGDFTITQQPATQSVVPGTTVVFTVGTSTDVPLCYQWLRDGTEITGAVGAQYRLTTVPDDTGARFSVRISIIGGATVTSTEATLTVAPDTIRPTLVSVVADASGNRVVVTFNEAMGASVESPATYSINGQAPSSVARNSPSVVTLTTGTTLQECVANVLAITGAADISGNLINPNPTTVTFTRAQVLVGNTGTQIWRYEDTGADLLTAWLAPGYDDSGWASGPGPLGLEDAAQMPAGWEIRTPTPNYVASRITYYFRTHFNLATDPDSVTRLQLTQVVDDGVIYWLNGQLLGTLRMTAPAAYSALAGGSTEPHPIETMDVPTSALQYGDNVLAAEVHQSGTGSTDLAFGAQLVATIVRCVPPLTIERVGSDVRLTWPDAAYRLERAPTPTGSWNPQAGASGVTLPAATGNGFFRLVTP